MLYEICVSFKKYVTPQPQPCAAPQKAARPGGSSQLTNYIYKGHYQALEIAKMCF